MYVELVSGWAFERKERHMSQMNKFVVQLLKRALKLF